jgi:hypothetical protein
VKPSDIFDGMSNTWLLLERNHYDPTMSTWNAAGGGVVRRVARDTAAQGRQVRFGCGAARSSSHPLRRRSFSVHSSVNCFRIGLRSAPRKERELLTER